MGLNLNDKKAVVAEVSAEVAEAQTIVLAEYRGIQVGDMTQLRANARENGVYMRVLKNTLARRAVEGTPFAELASEMTGPLIYSISKDAVAAAKVVQEFAKRNDSLVIRGREILHSLDERIVDLLRQDCCRDQVHDLFSFLHRLERRAECDLRLSVTDIPADQAVHDLLALHVPLRIVDRGELVIRLIVREHLLEFLLPDRIWSILESFRILSRRIELHELLRDLADCRADLRLRLRPLGSAKLI